MKGLSVENQLFGLRDIIIAMMRRDGRNFKRCELCKKAIKRFALHHEKYDGATYYDLKIICYSCNNKAENKLLQ